jgi:hypothetical protein
MISELLDYKNALVGDIRNKHLMMNVVFCVAKAPFSEAGDREKKTSCIPGI